MGKKSQKSCSSSSSTTCVEKPVKKCKKLECKRRIKVDMDVRPEVRVSDFKHTNAYFDIAVDLAHDDSCKIVKLKQEKKSPCESTCIFRVCVDSDVKACPRIVNQQPFSTTSFDLDVCANTDLRCREEDEEC